MRDAVIAGAAPSLGPQHGFLPRSPPCQLAVSWPAVKAMRRDTAILPEMPALEYPTIRTCITVAAVSGDAATKLRNLPDTRWPRSYTTLPIVAL